MIASLVERVIRFAQTADCAGCFESTERDLQNVGELADRVGFEPTKGLHPCRFSRPVHSTALPPVRQSSALARIGLITGHFAIVTPLPLLGIHLKCEKRRACYEKSS